MESKENSNFSKTKGTPYVRSFLEDYLPARKRVLADRISVLKVVIPEEVRARGSFGGHQPVWEEGWEQVKSPCKGSEETILLGDTAESARARDREARVGLPPGAGAAPGATGAPPRGTPGGGPALAQRRRDHLCSGGARGVGDEREKGQGRQGRGGNSGQDKAPWRGAGAGSAPAGPHSDPDGFAARQDQGR